MRSLGRSAELQPRSTDSELEPTGTNLNFRVIVARPGPRGPSVVTSTISNASSWVRARTSGWEAASLCDCKHARAHPGGAHCNAERRRLWRGAAGPSPCWYYLPRVQCSVSGLWASARLLHKKRHGDPQKPCLADHRAAVDSRRTTPWGQTQLHASAQTHSCMHSLTMTCTCTRAASRLETAQLGRSETLRLRGGVPINMAAPKIIIAGATL